jgi:hypothetical protein
VYHVLLILKIARVGGIASAREKNVVITGMGNDATIDACCWIQRILASPVNGFAGLDPLLIVLVLDVSRGCPRYLMHRDTIRHQFVMRLDIRQVVMKFGANSFGLSCQQNHPNTFQDLISRTTWQALMIYSQTYWKTLPDSDPVSNILPW